MIRTILITILFLFHIGDIYMPLWVLLLALAGATFYIITHIYWIDNFKKEYYLSNVADLTKDKTLSNDTLDHLLSDMKKEAIKPIIIDLKTKGKKKS